MNLLDIGTVSERTGIKPSAIRYYEDIGLIASVARKGLRRQFDPEIVLQLKLIAMGKTAGFSLEELAKMFGRDGQLQASREALHDKADEIDAQIRELKALRDSLRHVADCPAPSHLQCPKFRRLMTIAERRTSSASAGPKLRR